MFLKCFEISNVIKLKCLEISNVIKLKCFEISNVIKLKCFEISNVIKLKCFEISNIIKLKCSERFRNRQGIFANWFPNIIASEPWSMRLGWLIEWFHNQ